MAFARFSISDINVYISFGQGDELVFHLALNEGSSADIQYKKMLQLTSNKIRYDTISVSSLDS